MPQQPETPPQSEDVFSLPEGNLIIQYPRNLTKTSLAEVKAFLELFVRKVERMAKP